ncbi:hypothetical protein [Cereibacter changlensis]|uniref:Uncharacterized protein n=1 Tax=Cereibacter changlensis TaxID=402884 RepID=A0A2W7QV76_9RHOB|nr:hypothetical protein [Cereibacter changlensis]PZX50020.1 hypothetical protein LX76_03627 [Cereibacter changlensis]
MAVHADLHAQMRGAPVQRIADHVAVTIAANVLLVAGVRGSASEIIALASGRAEHGQRPRQR